MYSKVLPRTFGRNAMTTFGPKMRDYGYTKFVKIEVRLEILVVTEINFPGSNVAIISAVSGQ